MLLAVSHWPPIHSMLRWRHNCCSKWHAVQLFVCKLQVQCMIFHLCPSRRVDSRHMPLCAHNTCAVRHASSGWGRHDLGHHAMSSSHLRTTLWSILGFLHDKKEFITIRSIDLSCRITSIAKSLSISYAVNGSGLVCPGQLNSHLNDCSSIDNFNSFLHEWAITWPQIVDRWRKHGFKFRHFTDIFVGYEICK